MVHVGLDDTLKTAHIWVGLFWEHAPIGEAPFKPENGIAIAMTKYDGGVQTVNLHHIIDQPPGGFLFPTTFRVRAATDNGIINVNGDRGTRLLKGMLKSMLRVSEIKQQ